MSLDKITDYLFKSKTILEKVMKNKQSLNVSIFNDLRKAQYLINEANDLIKQSDYKKYYIVYNFDFLNEDMNYILIDNFYSNVMNILDNVQKSFDTLCKFQLSF